MNTIGCNIPIQLVSSNKRLVPSRGRFIASPEYRTCKEALTLRFVSGVTAREIKDCEVIIFLCKQQWKGDIDNVSKVILDALQSAEIIIDDKYINKLTIERSKTLSVSYIEIKYKR